MIIWHRNRRGSDCTTPRCRSRNIANNTFSEGWLQKSHEFAGLRTVPATHHAKNTANTTFSSGMLQNAGFGTIPCGGRGGGSEPRTGIIYRYTISDFNKRSNICSTSKWRKWIFHALQHATLPVLFTWDSFQSWWHGQERNCWAHLVTSGQTHGNPQAGQIAVLLWLFKFCTQKKWPKWSSNQKPEEKMV